MDLDLIPRLLLGVQGLVGDVSELMHMPNENLLIVVAILIDRGPQTREKSTQTYQLRNTSK